MVDENKAGWEITESEAGTLVEERGESKPRLKRLRNTAEKNRRIEVASRKAEVGTAAILEDDEINIFYIIDILLKNSKKIASLSLILLLVFCGFIATYLNHKNSTLSQGTLWICLSSLQV
jgi:hypothetical protein